jgi:hypothetical protein
MGMRDKNTGNGSGIDPDLLHIFQQYRAVGACIEQKSRAVVQVKQASKTPIGLQTRFPGFVVIDNG